MALDWTKSSAKGRRQLFRWKDMPEGLEVETWKVHFVNWVYTEEQGNSVRGAFLFAEFLSVIGQASV